MKKSRITTILGTRPELIRLSLIIQRLDQLFEHRLVHTGQNSDANLSEIFFNELKNKKTKFTFKGRWFFIRYIFRWSISSN